MWLMNRKKKALKALKKTRIPATIKCRHCKQWYTPLPPFNEIHRMGKCTD